MGSWSLHTAATHATGLPVRQLEHQTRRAVVSVTPLPDGTATISVSICVASPEPEAMAEAERLLEELAGRAIPEPGR